MGDLGTDADLATLMKNAFQDEALRRMARKAGVHGMSRKEGDDVNNALRALGYKILDTFCEKLAVYTEYRKSKTVSEKDFRNACDFLHIKFDFYATPSRENNTFPRCKNYKPGDVMNRRARGTRAELETRHENRDSAADCVYNEQAPFARLVRDIMEDHYRGVRFTPQTLSWLQFLVESILIKILTAAHKIVQDTTVGPRGGKPRATLSYRDIAAVVDTIKIFPNCVPVLDDSKEVRRAGSAGRRRKGRGKGRGRGGGGDDEDGDDGDGGKGGRGRGRGGRERGRGGSRGRGRAGNEGGTASGRSRGGRGSRGGGRGSGRAGTSARPRAKSKSTGRPDPALALLAYDKFGKFKDKGFAKDKGPPF